MTSNVAGRLRPPRVLSSHPMESTTMSRISASPSFDFKKRVSYDPDAKRLFHSLRYHPAVYYRAQKSA
jgi:hypothetical protein